MRLTTLYSLDVYGQPSAVLARTDEGRYCIPLSAAQAKMLGPHLGEEVACVVVPAAGAAGLFDDMDLEGIKAVLRNRVLLNPDRVYALAGELLSWCAAKLVPRLCEPAQAEPPTETVLPTEVGDGSFIAGSEVAEAAVREYLERRGWSVERINLVCFQGASVYGQPPQPPMGEAALLEEVRAKLKATFAR